jgi:hypothetical protein
VLDWDKRLEKYSPETKKKYEKGFQMMDEFLSILKEDKSNFKVTNLDKKIGYKCEQ